ncbi:MAG: phosphatidylglycerophosphatase A family protein [Planctomycetota bacterium]
MERLLTSCFGLGKLPVAPGTWGSLPPTIIFSLMCYFGAPAVLISIVMAALVLFGSVVCTKFADTVIGTTGKNDPAEVVADEFAGQAVTFLAVPLLAAPPGTGTRIWATAILGFLLFRLFDIIKPWPIRKLEKLSSGWGILADDLLAGIYATVVLLICVRLWIVGSTG